MPFLRRGATVGLLKKFQPERLCSFIVGGEALPLEVIRAWDCKGIKIRQGFSLTEAGPNLFSLHQDDAVRKIGSIGRADFYVETRLLDEQGQEVSPNEVGELCLRGPAATAKALPDG